MGSPKEVALDFTSRFEAWSIVRVCTLYLIGKGTLRVDGGRAGLGRPAPGRGPIRLTCSPERI